jgi:hypothetical protein
VHLLIAFTLDFVGVHLDVIFPVIHGLVFA